MIDPKIVIRRLGEARTNTLKILDDLNQEQLDWRPPEQDGEKAWSLGEVFMHLAIDEIYLREMIARPILEGIKPPNNVTYLPPPPPHGTQKEVLLFWFERARMETLRLFEKWPANADLQTTHEGGLREMNGLEWLDGYAGHEEFHHKQIVELISQMPSGSPITQE